MAQTNQPMGSSPLAKMGGMSPFGNMDMQQLMANMPGQGRTVGYQSPTMGQWGNRLAQLQAQQPKRGNDVGGGAIPIGSRWGDQSPMPRAPTPTSSTGTQTANLGNIATGMQQAGQNPAQYFQQNPQQRQRLDQLAAQMGGRGGGTLGTMNPGMVPRRPMGAPGQGPGG